MARVNTITSPIKSELFPTGIVSLVGQADNGARDLVSTAYNTAIARAETALATANGFLNSLSSEAAGLNPGTITAGAVTVDIVPSGVPTYQMSAFTPAVSSGNIDSISVDLIAAINALTAIPGNSAYFVEHLYSSRYITDVQTNLNEWVNGAATGIAPVVEQAIWDRGRTRELAAASAKSREAVKSFAMRGFSKPPGALSIELQDAAQTAQNNIVSLSRDIAIKQADLEQSNRRFAFEQAWKVEEGMINYVNAQMNRALELAKSLTAYAESIFNSRTSQYTARLSSGTALLGAQAQVLSARISADERYVSSANSANAQIQQANISANASMYGNAVQEHIAAFKAEVDANVASANLQMEVSKANIQAMIQQASLLIETIKGGAQVAAQLAASSMAGISMSAGLSDTTSNSASNTFGSTQSQSLGVSYTNGLSDSTGETIVHNLTAL